MACIGRSWSVCCAFTCWATRRALPRITSEQGGADLGLQIRCLVRGLSSRAQLDAPLDLGISVLLACILLERYQVRILFQYELLDDVDPQEAFLLKFLICL